MLAVGSPNAGILAGSPEENVVARRFLDVEMYDKQPMRERLSGLELEYRISANLFEGERQARGEAHVQRRAGHTGSGLPQRR